MYAQGKETYLSADLRGFKKWRMYRTLETMNIRDISDKRSRAHRASIPIQLRRRAYGCTIILLERPSDTLPCSIACAFAVVNMGVGITVPNEG